MPIPAQNCYNEPGRSWSGFCCLNENYNYRDCWYNFKTQDSNFDNRNDTSDGVHFWISYKDNAAFQR